MTESLLLSRLLPNGLTLEFFDLSRPMAGDRWQVILEVRLPIAVSAATLPPDQEPLRKLLLTRVATQNYNIHDGYVLTDNFNPVEYLVARTLQP